MAAISTQRVAQHDSPAVTQHLRRQLAMSVAYYRQHPQEIDQRLRELNAEWDVERALATGSSVLSLTGLALSLVKGRRWILLPLAVQGFFLQHAMEGWCPPLPVFRRLGFRTRHEIDRERYALKAIRGDFANFDRDTPDVDAESEDAEAFNH